MRCIPSCVIVSPHGRVRFEAMSVEEQLAFVRQNDINVAQVCTSAPTNGGLCTTHRGPGHHTDFGGRVLCERGHAAGHARGYTPSGALLEGAQCHYASCWLTTLGALQVPFEDVLDLVASRRVLLHKGFAFVPSSQLSSIVVGRYRAALSKALAVTHKAA